jgi:hypothetical protein
VKRLLLATSIIFLILPFLLSAVYAFKLPDSGQTKCYEDGGTETTCLDKGQDGTYLINRMSFIDNGNGTVNDRVTGLMWQQQDDGTVYNWYQATGTYSEDNNPSSQNVCADFKGGGYFDWRLPTIKELITIADYSIEAADSPAINTTFFPTWQSLYWTSTVYGGSSTGAWVISFADGTAVATGKWHTNYVRCVRGEQTGQGFTDNLDTTVTDSRTGLMWQQTEPGTFTHAGALNYCNTSSHAAYTDWRLPNIKELESLASDSLLNPTIDPVFFPSAVSDDYWSSTTEARTNAAAWTAGFADGYFDITAKDSTKNVRCVRGGGIVACPDQAATVSGSDVYQTTLQDAYTAADTGQTVLAQAMDFAENLAFSDNIVVTLKGGYECGFVSRPGFTSVNGKLTISSGTVTVENLIIR